MLERSRGYLTALVLLLAGMTWSVASSAARPVDDEVQWRRAYAEMLAEEQAIEEKEAKEAQEAKEDAAKVVDRVFGAFSDAAKADAQGKTPGEAEAERDGTEPPAKRRRRRTAAEISASLADVLGHEKVARLQLRAEDLHPLLVARYGH